MAFATSRNLEWLADCQEWFADGTYKTVPALFAQLYTIHGLMGEEVLPFIYALLPNKQEATYRRMLDLIIDHPSTPDDVHPQTVMMDFEKGAMNCAFQAKFLEAEIKACLFHLSQNVYKHVQSLGLQERYAQDAQFCLKVRHLTALGFVPTGDLFDGFELLILIGRWELSGRCRRSS